MKAHCSCRLRNHSACCPCRKELSPQKVLLRMRALHRLPAPAKAGGCDLAQHLTNYALHAVTRRMQGQEDPRMRALSSVSALTRLWVGSIDNYECNLSRVPLRRRRGDVHGDLTAVVIELGASGERASVLYVRELLCHGLLIVMDRTLSQ